MCNDEKQQKNQQVLDKVPEIRTLIIEDTQFPLKDGIG